MTLSTTAAPTSPRPSSRSGTTRRRAKMVGLSTLAAATTWILADGILDVEVSTPSFDSITPAADLGLAPVVLTAVITTLFGWALLEILERTTHRPRAVWASTAIAIAAVSLAGPLSGAGVSTSQRIVLVALHVVVAALFVPLMYRTIHTHGRTRS